MRRVIALCGLLAACHPPAGAAPGTVRVETWEVKNESPCDAPVRIQTYGGQLVQSLGTVPAGTAQSFNVFATLMKGNAITATPVEPDGTSLCRNNQNLLSKVIVRKLEPSDVN